MKDSDWGQVDNSEVFLCAFLFLERGSSRFGKQGRSFCLLRRRAVFAVRARLVSVCLGWTW